MSSNFIGVDLFAGAGGLSLGARMAGIDVALAIEKDKKAASTYGQNHRKTRVINDDICNVNNAYPDSEKYKILFGGPPCKGYSSSNQRTRNKENPSNWLFKQFLKTVCQWKPDYVVFENVKGFKETENKLFFNILKTKLLELNYCIDYGVLNAVDFGIPQKRSRFFLLASSHNKVKLPVPAPSSLVSVGDAINDLPILKNGARKNYLNYKKQATSDYAKVLRSHSKGCSGHLVTRNANYVVERYKYVPQGGNWESIPEHLMQNYKDHKRCHTGVYHRLSINKPSIVIGNYRKNMLIHPIQNRGLSVREAARLQSFPDWYEFSGSIGFQQQQVGNSVPPLLAKFVFESILT